MKHYLLPALIVSFFLVSPSVHAEDTTRERKDTSPRAEFRNEHKEQRHDLFKENQSERRELVKTQWEERKNWFASSTAVWKERFSEAAKERIQNRSEYFTNLFERVLERLSGIADRIEARIVELETDGADIALASAKLEEADGKIVDATEAVEALISALREAFSSEDPKASFEELKELKDAAKLALREAHAALKEAVQALPKRAAE